MKALQSSTQFITQLGELIRPKNEQEKRIRATYAMLVIAGAATVLIYKLI